MSSILDRQIERELQLLQELLRESKIETSELRWLDRSRARRSLF